jgi:hypothetical protein
MVQTLILFHWDSVSPIFLSVKDSDLNFEPRFGIIFEIYVKTYDTGTMTCI